MANPLNIVAMLKDSERFVVIYDDDSVQTALQQLGAWAADSTLPSFTWYDAARMSQRIRRLQQKL